MSATDVLFGQKDDRPVLGALALESLGFAPARTNKRLPPPTSGRSEKMGELLSLEQIYERFPSEWVLLEDPETTDTLQVKRGAVLSHSKDRDEVYRVALQIKPRRSAILYTGKLPEGTAIAL